MLDRQTTWIDDDPSDDESTDDSTQQPPQEPSIESTRLSEEITIAGFCGRTGKVADTCYCFWNVGALTVGKTYPARRGIVVVDNLSDSGQA